MRRGARPQSPQRPGRWDNLEKGFVVAVLYLMSGAAISVAPPATDFYWDPTEGNPFMHLLFLSAYAITLVLTLHYRRRFWPTLRGDRWLVALVGLAFASVAWSVLPDVTLRRGIALGGTTLFGVYLAMRYDAREQLTLVGIALGIAAVLSVIVALSVPRMGIAPDGWAGVFEYKNALGRAMVLGSLIFGLLAFRPTRQRWIPALGLVLGLMLVLLSASATARLVLLAVVFLLCEARIVRRHATLLVPTLVLSGLLLAGGAWWAWYNAHTVLEHMGRDLTLTGRTSLWEVVLEAIRERAWLGYGYGAFWDYEFGQGDYISHLLGWDVPHAHNGFLELALQIGWIGNVVFLLGFAAAVIRSLRRSREPPGLWPFGYLAFVFLYNLTESTVLVRNSLFWTVYVATALTVAGRTHPSLAPEAHVPAMLGRARGATQRAGVARAHSRRTSTDT